MEQLKLSKRGLRPHAWKYFKTLFDYLKAFYSYEKNRFVAMVKRRLRKTTYI